MAWRRGRGTAESISARRAGALDSAVMDIGGEDNETITALKGQYHWDSRQKKYVKLQPGEQVCAPPPPPPLLLARRVPSPLYA